MILGKVTDEAPFCIFRSNIVNQVYYKCYEMLLYLVFILGMASRLNFLLMAANEQIFLHSKFARHHFAKQFGIS